MLRLLVILETNAEAEQHGFKLLPTVCRPSCRVPSAWSRPRACGPNLHSHLVMHICLCVYFDVRLLLEHDNDI